MSILISYENSTEENTESVHSTPTSTSCTRCSKQHLGILQAVQLFSTFLVVSRTQFRHISPNTSTGLSTNRTTSPIARWVPHPTIPPHMMYRSHNTTWCDYSTLFYSTLIYLQRTHGMSSGSLLALKNGPHPIVTIYK